MRFLNAWVGFNQSPKATKPLRCKENFNWIKCLNCLCLHHKKSSAAGVRLIVHYALQRLDDARHATKWNILLALATRWKFQLSSSWRNSVSYTLGNDYCSLGFQSGSDKMHTKSSSYFWLYYINRDVAIAIFCGVCFVVNTMKQWELRKEQLCQLSLILL